MKTTHSPKNNPDPEEVLRKCTNILAEHYDAVQIIVSRVSPDGSTSMSTRGAGNYYARVQMAQTFIDRHKAEHIADFVVRGMKDDD